MFTLSTILTITLILPYKIENQYLTRRFSTMGHFHEALVALVFQTIFYN